MKKGPSVYDPSFRYTSSAQTDLRKTFARIRRKQKEEAEAQAAVDAEAKTKVAPIGAKKAVGR